MTLEETTRSYRRIGAVVAVLIALSGYGPMAPPAQAWEHEGAGWYGNMGFECYDASYCTGDLQGYVGLPVEWSPLAHCTGGDWYIDGTDIVTGSLPPGLYFADGNIVGVPERAGTWYLRVQFTNMNCTGTYYGDPTQDLHITTEGSSAPRSLQ